MKNYLFTFILSFCSLFAYAQSYNYQNLEIDYRAHSQNSAKEYTFKNLRLYPIRAKESFIQESEYLGKYTPLKEALSTKKIVITETETGTTNTDNQNIQQNNSNIRTNDTQILIDDEPIRQVPANNQNNRNNRNNQVQIQNQQVIQQRSTGANVNKLFAQNISKDTIYLMAGEVIQGGKQDRVIAQDMILPPNSKAVELPVFCVEHGRWSYKKSPNDTFDSYYGVSSMALRGKVDKSKNQQEVWSEVERSNKKNEVKSSTGAYTEQANSEAFRKKKEEYLAYFKDKFSNEKDIIGVIVATGDKVAGCDIFASPHLFTMQFGSLLDSYINEAITDGSEVKIQQASVEAYMDKLLKDEVGQEKFIEKNGKAFKDGKRKLHISTY